MPKDYTRGAQITNTVQAVILEEINDFVLGRTWKKKVFDISGKDRHPTVYGGTKRVHGRRNGAALKFDPVASNRYQSLIFPAGSEAYTYLRALTGNRTVTADVCLMGDPGVPGRNHVIVSTGNLFDQPEVAAGAGWMFHVDANEKLALSKCDGANNRETKVSTGVLKHGQWYSVGYMYDAVAKSVEFFIDGVSDGAAQVFNNVVVDSAGGMAPAIGGEDGINDQSEDAANMCLDSLMVWDTLLSAANMARLANGAFTEGNLPVANLQLWLDFDEAFGGDYDWIGPMKGTFSHPNSVNEETLLEIAGVDVGTEIMLMLDLNAMTKSTEIRVYEKIDGVNYRSIDPKKVWSPTADEKAVRFNAHVSSAFKITVKTPVAEGAARNIPFRWFRRAFG